MKNTYLPTSARVRRRGFTRIEQASVVAVGLAIAAGLVAFGRFSANIEKLETDVADLKVGRTSIASAREQALDDIKLAKEQTMSSIRQKSISVPIGGIIAWPGELPGDKDWWDCSDGSRWHVCNGKPVEISGPDDPLAEALGTTYGTAEQPTRFVKLPGFQNHFLRGAGSAAAALGVPQPESLKEHEHSATVDDPKHSHSFTHTNAEKAGHNTERGEGTNGEAAVDESATNITVDIGKTGGKETRPANFAVHWIIRVK